MNAEERQATLKKIAGIRVTDWHDAMDTIGLFDRGLMGPEVRPLWRDIEEFRHCIAGFAFTLRYVPATRTIVARDVKDFQRQEGEWYGRDANWAAALQKGDLIVIDGTDTKDTGYVGSMNSMVWLSHGAVGIVTNNGVRDTDELIKQKVPVYCNGFSRGIIPGRVILDTYQQPVQCGGVYVKPGDLVIADGDGVIVIPQDRVEDAFAVAKKIQVGDQKSRAQLYKRLSIPSDFTLGQSAKEAD